MKKTSVRKSNARPLKIGFDFDGVIMYNPIRIIRPLIAFLKRKKIGIQRKEMEFFIPQKNWEKLLFRLFHQTSIFPAKGLDIVERLSQQQKIEPYIITARFDFLRHDLEYWLKKIHAEQIFKQWFHNKDSEQPHLFKARMIEQLGLDVFIEDNWNIVQYLDKYFKKKKLPVKVFWVYNLFDKKIPYHSKHPHLLSVLKKLLHSQQLRKKKVLVVTDFFIPHWTGISKSLFQLLNAHADHYRFTVLTVQTAGTSAHESMNGYNVIRTKPTFALSRTFISLPYLIKLWQLVRTHDHVFINSPCTYVFVAALFGKLFGKQVTIFHQGDLNLPTSFFNSIIQALFNWQTLTAAQLADQVSTYTDDYAQYSRILKHVPDKWRNSLIPLTQPTTTQSIPQLATLRKKHRYLLGFAGRFVEEKGFDVLFAAIPQMLKAEPSLHFVFAGETVMKYEHFFEQKQDLFEKIRPHVTLLGLLNDEQLITFYQSIDLLVVPSRNECFGLIQAEAMLQGTPVVISDIPGGRYLVNTTSFGTTFTTEDSHDLATKVLEILPKLKKLKHEQQHALAVLNYQRLVEQSQRLFE